MAAAIELIGITKRFPGVIANDNVNLTVEQGEIHAICGENGAGKSTLMKILYGMQPADEGVMRVNGKEVRFSSPTDAIAEGIGMVHQHFMLADQMSVIENVILGSEPTKAGVIDFAGAKQHLAEVGAAYGLTVDPDDLIDTLEIGEQQRVEIIKVLYRGATIVILDEPTAALTPDGVERLFASIRTMQANGLAVILISHKMHEVTGVSDQVTVLRKGKVVGTVETASTDAATLTRMMVGRSVELSKAVDHPEPAQPVLEVEGLHAGRPDERGSLRGVDLTVRAGEIYGIAGVSGNGQSFLYDVLVGARELTDGIVTINGHSVAGLGPRRVARIGVGSVPEDRINQALLMDFRIDENLALGRHWDAPNASKGVLRRKAMVGQAEGAVEAYDIACPSPTHVTRTLSGGNLQKVVLARELEDQPDLIVVHQPTRGLDISAADNVRRRLIAERDRGAAVVLLSDDLDEVLSLSTTVGVMFEGTILGEMPHTAIDIERIGLLMAGVAA